MKATTIDVLGDRLRTEAGPPPEFSPLLHERVMATLRTRGLDPPASDAAPHSPWRLTLRIAIPAAVAAAVALTTWLGFQHRQTPGGAGQAGGIEILTSLPAGPENVDPTTVLLPMMREALDSPQALVDDTNSYTSLDKDAQRLAMFVADQLPSFNLPEPRP